MKTKRLNKLVLNKVSIARLDNDKLKQVKGGDSGSCLTEKGKVCAGTTNTGC